MSVTFGTKEGIVSKTLEISHMEMQGSSIAIYLPDSKTPDYYVKSVQIIDED